MGLRFSIGAANCTTDLLLKIKNRIEELQKMVVSEPLKSNSADGFAKQHLDSV